MVAHPESLKLTYTYGEVELGILYTNESEPNWCVR